MEDANTLCYVLTSGVIYYFLDDGHHLVRYVRIIVHQMPDMTRYNTTQDNMI